MPEPIKIELTLDLNSYMADDVEPFETLEAAVIDLAAQKVADITLAQVTTPAEIHRRTFRLRDDLIREKLEPIIEEAMVKALTPTNKYGEPVGPPTTLTETIAGMAEKAMKIEIVADGNGRTLLDKMVAAVVKGTLRSDLQIVCDEARAEQAIRNSFPGQAEQAGR